VAALEARINLPNITPHTQTRRKKPYLVDNRVLGKCFREKFINGLRRLFERGELKLDGPWSDLLDPKEAHEWIDGIESQDWNVFIEGPPDGKSDPKQVLKYLARYMTGGPIADSRLISQENDHVTFWARPKTNRPGQAKGSRKQPEPFTLKCTEFVRRWTMHILPKGFTRTRCYGGYSGARREAYLQLCTKLLQTQPEPFELTAAKTLPEAEVKFEPQPLTCPKCECELNCLSSTARPSWRVVFERIYREKNLYNPMWHGWCYQRRPTPRRNRPLKPDG
jgi:hypothetical protein